MTESEMKRLIAQEVRKNLNVILQGSSGANTEQQEDINELFPGMSAIPARPVMHPYGHVSRAPQGTLNVVAKQGEHPGNRMVLGHRDSNKPKDLEEGETMIYSVGDYRVKVSKTKIEVAKGEDYEPVVVGETLRQFLITLVELIIQHTHLGNLGYQTSPPQNFTDFQQAQEQNLDNKKILAEDGGRY